MIPYADTLYFGILLYVALVVTALGLLGRISWRWVAAINVVMLVVQYGGTMPSLRPVATVAMFGAFQWLNAAGFLRARSHGAGAPRFRLALLLALTPLVAVKFVPGASGYAFFLGISYVTFRSLDVVICINDRLIRSLPPVQYVTYVLFFPAISSGPVDRYNRFAADFAKRRTRAEFLADLDVAVQRLFRGLLYKFVLGTLVSTLWLEPAAARDGVLATIAYMYAYAFFLFFDLAGYSAFAIAVSYLLGIHTPENFNRPFLATDIADFWNRWHITLSTWFRDHVYMRFVMASMRGKWFSSKLLMSCVAFYLSFGLMGLWHGTAARYLIYGLYHGTLLSLHALRTRNRKPGRGQVLSPTRRAIDILVTFHLVCIGLLIFSGRLG